MNPDLNAEFQLSDVLGSFPALPRGPLPSLPGTQPPLASGGASSGDQSITASGERSACCATARAYRKEIRTLSRRLHAKEMALTLKTQLLQQRDTELLEKESVISSLKSEKESVVNVLKQDLLRASSTAFCLRREIEFWKSGVAQVDMWRERFSALEEMLLARSLGFSGTEAGVGSVVPVPPEG